MEIIRNVYYEVFDKNNENELIDTCDTLEDAIESAKENKNYAVDLIIELEDENGENILDDNLYTIQVYPTVKTYPSWDNNVLELEV